MADVFLSYKREKKDRVRLLADALGREGYSVFWDARLRTSADYIQQLNQELMASRAVVVCWCPQSIKSPWVMSEAIKAFQRGVILPVLIESVDELNIPAPFNIIQTLNLANWDGSSTASQWFTFKEDLRLLMVGNSSQVVEVDEAADADAMASEIFSGVAGAVALTPIAKLADPEHTLDEVRAFIRECVVKGGGSVSQASVAGRLQQKWPKSATQFNWFGHRRFSKFFLSLSLSDLQLDANPPGRIVKVGEGVTVLPVVQAPSPTAVAKFGEKLFEASGAPKMSSEQYRAALVAMSEAVHAGARTVSEISKQMRDRLAGGQTPVSRARASFIAKGALIGGLNLAQTPLRPAMIALCFASALNALCVAGGLEIGSSEQDEILHLIGFGDL